jgi:hypothetical protein
MPSFSSTLPRQPGFLAASFVFAAISVSAAAQSPPVVNGPAIPAGEGRVWFYRVFLPEDSGDMPAIAINGRVVGYARAGWSFYRDMPAGAYRATVASFGSSTSTDIALKPGTQVALSIQSSPLYISNLGGLRRGTFDVTAEPGGAAYQHIEQTRFGTGY